MKKRIMAGLLAAASVLAVAGCSNSGSGSTTTTTAAPAATTAAPSGGDTTTAAPADTTAAPAAPASEEGGVFNIYAWNEEFKGFFEKYMPGYDASAETLDGIKVKWTINPSDNGVYQDKLDQALQANASAAADDKVDMFLAEADYILKYTDSDYTLDVSTIGVSQVPTEYQYTVSAASDANGKIKGVSFQCCPSALIYRRSIAKEVLGTDDPDAVQGQLDSWDKFDAVAAKAKDLGYYMTASFAETYRVFSNNADSAWVTGGELTMPSAISQWIDQADTYLKNGYTLTSGIWGDEKNAQMFADGKTMCFFGPAWYFNFCMGNAQDPEKGCSGDWAICKGPQGHFWGGTWMLAATGTDNGATVAKVMKAFTENEEVCENLIVNEGQFTNNKTVNEKFANDPSFGSDFLGGQNATAVFCGMTDSIVWANATIYDQLLNEGLQTYILDYYTGNCSKDEALQNFYGYINEKYPAIVTP
ncbi:MAG: ABC transporter substrate-binding protein [Ruminiclostridium sp.]|nr:ABC transporter substrate-binding protein [Ruminiclostridium sp.]